MPQEIQQRWRLFPVHFEKAKSFEMWPIKRSCLLILSTIHGISYGSGHSAPQTPQPTSTQLLLQTRSLSPTMSQSWLLFLDSIADDLTKALRWSLNKDGFEPSL